MEIMKYVRAQWDRLVGIGALIVGIIAIILGYYGVSGTPHVAAQLPYFISGGVFGLFMLGVACMAWLSADLRDEWRELHAIRTVLEQNGQDSDQEAGVYGHGEASPARRGLDRESDLYEEDLIDPTPVHAGARVDESAYATAAAGDSPADADSKPTPRRASRASSSASRSGTGSVVARTKRARTEQ